MSSADKGATYNRGIGTPREAETCLWPGLTDGLRNKFEKTLF